MAGVSHDLKSIHYGVATISRLLKITSLFCKRALLKRRYSAKETYNFKEPTNRSHPIDRDKPIREGGRAAQFRRYRSNEVGSELEIDEYYGL